MELLAKLKDGGIVDVSSEQMKYGGCETCDYGSHYIDDIVIELEHNRLDVHSDKMYDYALSSGDIMRIMLKEAENFRNMTELDFVRYFSEEVLKLNPKSEFKLNSKPYNPSVVEGKNGELSINGLLTIVKVIGEGFKDFKIKGKDANINDFGYLEKSKNGVYYIVDDYGGTRDKTCDKYGINSSEYWRIANFLKTFVE